MSIHYHIFPSYTNNLFLYLLIFANSFHATQNHHMLLCLLKVAELTTIDALWGLLLMLFRSPINHLFLYDFLTNYFLTIANLLYIRIFAFICRCFIRNYVTTFQQHYLRVREFNNCSRSILSRIIKIIFYFGKKLLYLLFGIGITIEFGNQYC